MYTTISKDSEKNLEIFYQNPDQYLLSVVRHKGSEISVNLMEKGIVTWTKIHVGGLLGLFDASTLKMQHISTLLLQVDSQEENFANFKRAFLLKKRKFEQKHFSLFDPSQKTLDIKIFKSISLNDSDSQITNNIINNINSMSLDLFTGVISKKYNNCIFSKLSYSNLISLKTINVTKSNDEINVENILKAILLGDNSGKQDLEKVAQRGYRNIYISLSFESNEIRAKICAI